MGKSMQAVVVTKAQEAELHKLFGTNNPHVALATYRAQQGMDSCDCHLCDNLPAVSGPAQPLLWEERNY